MLSFRYFIEFCLIFIFNVLWPISRNFEGMFYVKDIFTCSDIISTRNNINIYCFLNFSRIWTRVAQFVLYNHKHDTARASFDFVVIFFFFRRLNWEKNIYLIDEHNRKADQGIFTYWLGLNEYADMVSDFQIHPKIRFGQNYDVGRPQYRTFSKIFL